jgi:Fe-S-cluster-containing hydrogenase component 2/CRP-like cAMP-binding protein
MAKKEIVKNPGADLVADVPLPDEEMAKLSLFAQLKRKVSLEKFPNFVVVRRFKKGDIICRQGEPGWTAFYILTPDDCVSLLEYQLAHATERNDKVRISAEIEAFHHREGKRKANPADNEARHMATVYLAVKKSKKRSGAQRLENNRGRSLDGMSSKFDEKTFFMPVDASVNASFENLRAPLLEGELFGEISCMYRTPRSATILARRDCYMLEMLRNILEAVQRDPSAEPRIQKAADDRFLNLEMRKMPVFGDLNDAQFEDVKKIVQLVRFEPGQLLCDEHDRADGVYIVRSGLVKAMRNTSALLIGDDILDWNGLLTALRAGSTAPVAKLTGDDLQDWRALLTAARNRSGAAPTPTTPAPIAPLHPEGLKRLRDQVALGKIWEMLPKPSRDAVERITDVMHSTGIDRAEVMYGINDILKKGGLADAREFAHLLATNPMRERGQELLARRKELKTSKKDWSDPELRRFNRYLVEALMPTALRPVRSAGVECILEYHAAGEYVGETGVMNSSPQNVSCLAYGQPNDEGQVLAVKIPAADFRALCDKVPALKEKVKRVMGERRRYIMERLLTPVWDDTRQVQLTENFEALGLIQGQRLMLIDLERCTRCDECVKACVETHDDGRTRLFLDGPRFGKYLVPVSCRSCLDPVCMIPCPVSSIHRGSNREMVIEDWCIGCGLCAESCPYGSIQMHDLGIIPERQRDWQYTTGSLESGEKWRTRADGGKWLTGVAPLYFDRDMKESLKNLGRSAEDEPVLLRLPFAVSSRDLVDAGRKPGERRPVESLRLIVTTHAPAVKVWLDGTPLPDAKPKQGRREYALGVKGVKRAEDDEDSGAPPAFEIGAGRHILAVEVTIPKLEKGKLQIPLKRDGSPGELLMAGLYAERRPDLPEGVAAENVAEEVTEKLVSQRAVVCDLCSKLHGKSPACVRACPHDAAFRVDARKNFPQH